MQLLKLLLRISVVFSFLLSTACSYVPVGDTNLEKASKINVQLGIGYYNQGNLEVANQKLVKAISQNPESSQAHHAYAVLQNRFLDTEKAEFHFKKAIQYDPANSEALNNYGAFLCKAGRITEAEVAFLKAIENPLYKYPEIAYTSAAACVQNLGPDEQGRAVKYLQRALAKRNNFQPALINMADILFAKKDYKFASLYLDRYHQVSKSPSARSLWLAARNELELGHNEKAAGYIDQLKDKYPNSNEYKAWLKLEND